MTHRTLESTLESCLSVPLEMTAHARKRKPVPHRYDYSHSLAYLASVAAFMGRHHHSLSRYQVMVRSIPSEKLVWMGFHPSSSRSLDGSMA